MLNLIFSEIELSTLKNLLNKNAHSRRNPSK